MKTAPVDLSVVVTVVSGGETVRRTVRRLLGETPRPWLEVLVPLEEGHPERDALVAELRGAAFPRVAVSEGASLHERYDRRRTAGILASRAPIVGIVEDHGTPAPDWPERVVAAHRALPHAAIGGVVGNGIATPLNDALWLCDFGRYAPPQDPGARPTLTDVNVSYKRDPLFAVRPAWDPRYHEPLVHDALRERGETLWLDPAIAVEEERPGMSLGAALRERYEWGRLFGTLRGRRLPPWKRVLYGAASTVLMPLLAWRIWIRRRGRIGWGRLLAATPWIKVLLFSWCLGEAAVRLATVRG
jgi:hypothetical protein